jgi:hypothetical protein
MDTTETTNPAEAEIKAVEAEVENDETNSSTETPAADDSDAEGQAAEPEFEDIEIDGKIVRVPKEIAPHVMKNADYTQKTQALAEQRRAWEAQEAEARASIQRESEMFEALKAEQAQLVAIDGRIEALRNIDVNRLNPADQQRYWNEVNQLNQARSDLGSAVQNRRDELTAERERQDANAWAKTVESLNTPDERLGWSGKFDEPTQARLAGIARELGVPDHEISAIRNPVTIKALHLVGIGLETLKKGQAALSAKPATPVAKPVPTVGGAKATGTVNPDKLSADEWVKWRNKQVAKQRA